MGFFILTIWVSQGSGHELDETSMSVIFDQWIVLSAGVYKDAEEKTQRFKIFKDTIKFRVPELSNAEMKANVLLDELVSLPDVVTDHLVD